MSEIDTMSKEELAKEKAETEKRLAALRKAEAEYDQRRLKELKAKVEEMLKAEGFSMADLTGGKPARKTGGAKPKGEAKYRHPENPELTWSGRGRQPQWYKDHLQSGGKPEDLAA